MDTAIKEARNPHRKTTAVDRQPVLWVISTHWDREWYESFQGFRYRLIGMLDEVLDLLDNDERFSRFQMDGQSIPIEDYLEARPERAEQVRRLAAQGKLAIGPWYVLPDEFLVSGESLVRNLQEGLRVASQWGSPSRTGFVCDIFGHNSQLPQILRGFGIDMAFVWRGINEAEAGSFFRWVSPDGSSVLSHQFGPQVGYCDFAFNMRHAHEAEAIPDPAQMAEQFGDYIQKQQARCAVEMPIMVFDGGDHMEVDSATGDILNRIQQGELADQFDVRLATLDEFAATCRMYDWSALPVIKGEMRRPATETSSEFDQQWIIPGVLSSRMPLKQANARCETLLTQWAEPWSVFAAPLGLEYPQKLLQIAWRYLLRNHAHDSICGCSIDQVHRDMEYRFDQARLIAERLRRAALDQLANQVVRLAPATETASLGCRQIVLVNPTARAIDEPVDITVRLPEDSPKFQEFFGYEQKPGFWLSDAAGARLPYQRISQASGRMQYSRTLGKFPRPGAVHEVEVTAHVRIPAFGYTSICVEPATRPTRHADKGLVCGPRQAENEWLKMEVDTNGTLRLTDKRTAQQYTGLLELEDRADIGDGWYHGQAVNDQTFYSGSVSASVACVADGPEKAEFLIELDWPLPECFEFDAMRRSGRRQTLHITHQITLRAGCARLEVHTCVENSLQDHRLRVLLPSGARADEYLADAPFDVVRRPIALAPNHIEWRELEVETKPQRTWTAVNDARRGLAVIASGLHESAVLDCPGHPIALTLLRGFKKTVFTDGEPGGQLQGTQKFDYWIAPLLGEPDVAELCWLGQRLAAGIGQVDVPVPSASGRRTDEHPNKHSGPQKPLAASHGFLEVNGPVVVTALRRGANGETVLRLFNPGTEAAPCQVGCPDGFNRAWLGNLEEHAQESLSLTHGALNVEVPPKRIMTFLLE